MATPKRTAPRPAPGEFGIHIVQHESGQFGLRVMAGNNECVLHSEPMKNHADALAMADKLVAKLADAVITDLA